LAPCFFFGGKKGKKNGWVELKSEERRRFGRKRQGPPEKTKARLFKDDPLSLPEKKEERRGEGFHLDLIS